jgi:biotin transport system substrate-specific component
MAYSNLDSSRSSSQLQMMVYSSLFVALIAVGAFIAIPVGPVPIVLQNMFVLLAAIILGPVWALVCVAIYLVIGLAGLPVFAGGTSGIGKLFGPTGGYLLGYLPCVFVTAWISKALGHKLISDMLAMLIGSLIVYAVGVPWLSTVIDKSLQDTLVVGMYPFLIGDAVKVVAAAFIAKSLRPLISL